MGCVMDNVGCPILGHKGQNTRHETGICYASTHGSNEAKLPEGVPSCGHKNRQGEDIPRHRVAQGLLETEGLQVPREQSARTGIS